MVLGKVIKPLQTAYAEYPRQFWILIFAMFIDTVGRTVLNPFLTLYATEKFQVGMTEVGTVFGIMAIASAVGGTFGGALADRLGRKGMVIAGLVISGLSSLTMGLVGSFELFFGVVIFVGLVGSIGHPAQFAMITDLLPEEKRAGGFGIFRVIANLAWVCGPIIGGLLIARSYMPIFVCDAVGSAITALIVVLAIRETRPATPEDAPKETLVQTFAGYRHVLKDVTFVLFIGACLLMTWAYLQMYTTMGVYLRDTHGISEREVGYIFSINAAIVVLAQFPIARRVAKYPPMLMMAAGVLLYAVGFAMFGVMTSFVLFVLAVTIITVGEMIAMPTNMAVIAHLAPDDMRGRYGAIFGFTGLIANATGPLLAGLVMDNADPRLLWYAVGLVALASTAAFVLLHRRYQKQTQSATTPTVTDT